MEDQIRLFNLREKVEICALMDNRSIEIAEKRNSLLTIATGNFLTFLDDDDLVSTNYLYSLVKTIEDNPNVDCITFNQLCSIDGLPLEVTFGLGNPHEKLVRQGNLYNPIKRPPYHVCAWKSEIAKTVKFEVVHSPSGQSIEDINWVSRLYPLCKKSFHINDTLHYYVYNTESTCSIKTP